MIICKDMKEAKMLHSYLNKQRGLIIKYDREEFIFVSSHWKTNLCLGD